MLTLLDYPIIYQQQVAWGDMDAFGHVNNVIYYRYMESARIDYMNKLDILREDIYTVVASNQCKYMRPVFYPDQLKIGVRVEEVRSSAFRMSYLLWSELQQQVVATGDAVIVCVDKVEMQKIKIPDNIRKRLIETELKVNHQI
ncbi:MAG: thioesterase family protein [Acinetobacter sp.]|jgi:acyl-CoA thioester hydrolase|uniref:Acyl-CoA thioester hydrolase n=1 Tax=Acinetobacter albensis TaxID=1673609 RepID=A0A1C4GVW4_9GAMM|nr:MULTISPECIES: thioesterase family protein [Acinetobacter]ALD02537.1 thioesterase [Acinetobacter sp. TTH0-4]MBE9402077.1 acyl-CoA thioesterase [Acinetobacter albensis]SCC72312.1 acyl-CoA thioester hydrolase [Acinetobacter albensis]